MSLAGRLFGTRAAAPAVRTNAAPANVATTATLSYTSPGMAQYPDWDAETALRRGYLGYVYAYRCARHIAQTVASLPFRASAELHRTAAYDTNATLARLLGPPPGGPAKAVSARDLWIWSIVQYLFTGRFAWETTTTGPGKTVDGLWPLPVHMVNPIPSAKNGEWWSGYRIRTRTRTFDLPLDRLFYAWRPGQLDFRQAESVVQAAALPLGLAVDMDRFASAYMANNLVGSKLIVTEQFDESESRRAFQDQFVSMMAGPNNAGRMAFAEWVADPAAPPNQRAPSVQVVDLGSKLVDAQFRDLQDNVRDVICDAFGVPRSMVGTAAERTFCVDTETEILTARGWLDYQEVHDGDLALTLDPQTRQGEWLPVEAVNVFDGPHDVVRMEGGRHSSVSTPNHRWPTVRTSSALVLWWRQTHELTRASSILSTDTGHGLATDPDLPFEMVPVGELDMRPDRIDGPVWCPTTRNGTWLARRDGTTYFTGNSNADQEHRNYWTATVVPLLAELADKINIGLAPRIGTEVGWFDVSGVEALRPGRMFVADTPANLIASGIVTRQEVRADFGLPAEPLEGLPEAGVAPVADDITTGVTAGGGSRRQITPLDEGYQIQPDAPADGVDDAWFAAHSAELAAAVECWAA